MSDSARWHRFDLEKVGDFIRNNLRAMKFDVDMDPEVLKGCIEAAGVFVEMDSIGWSIVKRHPSGSSVVVAALPYRDALNSKADKDFYQNGRTVNPGKRLVYATTMPKIGACPSAPQSSTP